MVKIRQKTCNQSFTLKTKITDRMKTLKLGLQDKYTGKPNKLSGFSEFRIEPHQ